MEKPRNFFIFLLRPEPLPLFPALFCGPFIAVLYYILTRSGRFSYNFLFSITAKENLQDFHHFSLH